MRNRFLYAPGTDSLLVDEAFTAAGAQIESRWIAADHAGTVRDVIDGDNHALLEHREYEAFGERILAIDGGKVDVAPANLATDFAFAGREWDYEADLFYNRARWLDEDLGRFISEDPIGFAGGDASLYRNTGNYPVNARDSSGLSPSIAPLNDAIHTSNGSNRLPFINRLIPGLDTSKLQPLPPGVTAQDAARLMETG